MSVSYSLEVIKAVIAILKADNSDPDVSNNELCIHTYCVDRVYQSNTPIQDIDLPYITVSSETGPGDGNLPAESGVLIVKSWYNETVDYARTKCRRLGARIIGLLDRRPDILTSNCNIIVRLIDKTDELYNREISKNLYFGTIVFELIFKREIE